MHKAGPVFLRSQVAAKTMHRVAKWAQKLDDNLVKQHGQC